MNVFESALRQAIDAMDLDEEARVRAVRISVDYGELQARSLAGEDVSEELTVVEATMAQIVARNAVSVALVARRTLVAQLTRVLTAVATAV